MLLYITLLLYVYLSLNHQPYLPIDENPYVYFFVGFFGAETINNLCEMCFFDRQEVEKHLGKEAWVPQIWKLLD